MISLGKYHKHVPRDPVENVRLRRDILIACNQRPDLRQRIMDICEQDSMFWIGMFGWQVNPRHVGNELGPFIPWDFQLKAGLATIKRLWVEGKDVVWEKSRELGATWFALFIMLWASLFLKWKKFLTFSHTVEAVDRPDDPDSLFWKMTFILDGLPPWMSRGATKQKGVIKCPHTNSAITGVASTKRTGVGGRATSIFSDETGRQENARQMIGQTRDTGPRLFCSTHYGINDFYELCKRPDIFKCIMHWSEHPEKRRGLYKSGVGENGYEIIDKSYPFPKDYPFVTTGKPNAGPYPGIRSVYYDEEVRERNSDRDVAMHLDIYPEGADEQFFSSGVIFSLIKDVCHPPDWEGDAFIDHHHAEVIQFVQRPGGSLRFWGFSPHGRESPAGKYVVGCDVSQGTGATPSCASFGNANTSSKVCEFLTNRMTPEEFAEHVVSLCKFFRKAYLAWEIPGPGLSMAERVIDLGYKNIYYHRDDKPHTMTPTFSERPGWVNTPSSKLRLLSKYRAYLLGRQITNPSERALKETLAFRYTSSGMVEHPGERSSNDFSGAGVSHGDIAMSDAMMCELMTDVGISKIKKIEPRGPKPGGWEWRQNILRQQDESDGEDY